MRHRFYTMLFGAIVLVSAFDEADSFVTDFNEAGSGTQPETIVNEQHQVQEPINVGETYNFVSGAGEGAQPETIEDQINVFFGESEGKSAATGEGIFSDTTSDVPIPTQDPNVRNDSADETSTPAEEIKPSTEIVQVKEPTIGHFKEIGFFDMFKSLVHVFTGSYRVNNPSPMEVNSQTPTTVSRFSVSQDSEEGNGSFEEDSSDEMPPPMSVRLAQIKQFVRANTATGYRSVRTSPFEQDDHHVMTEVSPPKQPVVGRSQTLAPPPRVVHVITESDEHDNDHSNEQDMSLEVDINLLPEIRRFLKAIIANRETTSQRTLVFKDYEDPYSSLLGTKDISENPVFQTKIEEIDDRLKRASGTRGKRLMEKYAEALTLYSPASLNMASTSVTFSCFLPIFITCLLARLS